MSQIQLMSTLRWAPSSDQFAPVPICRTFSPAGPGHEARGILLYIKSLSRLLTSLPSSHSCLFVFPPSSLKSFFFLWAGSLSSLSTFTSLVLCENLKSCSTTSSNASIISFSVYTRLLVNHHEVFSHSVLHCSRHSRLRRRRGRRP